MKGFRRVGGLSFAAAMVVVAVSSGCDPSPRPALWGLPDSALLDGQEISVTGYGYASHVMFTVVQCPVGADSVDDCNQDSIVPVSTDDQRHFETTTFVDATFDNGHGERIDCRGDGACELVSFPIRDVQGRLSSPLDFSGRDGLRVTPDRNLADDQVVTIQGRTSARSVKLFQCPRGIDNYTQCDQSTLRLLEVQEDGTFQAEVTLLSVIHAFGSPRDCTDPASCILAADIGGVQTIEDFRIVSPQWAPLEFD